MPETHEKPQPFSPYLVFNEVLLRMYAVGEAEFSFLPKSRHNAFYTAKTRFPDVMNGFEVISNAENFVVTLDEIIEEYQKIGIFYFDDPLKGHLKIPNSSAGILERALERRDDAKKVAAYICNLMYAES